MKTYENSAIRNILLKIPLVIKTKGSARIIEMKKIRSFLPNESFLSSIRNMLLMIKRTKQIPKRGRNTINPAPGGTKR